MSSFVFDEIKYPDDLRAWTNTNFKNRQVVVSGASQWQSPDKADPWLK